MNRNHGETLLSERLEDLILTRFGRRPLELVRLSRIWSELAGEQAGIHSRPAWIRKDVLWVFVDGSGWMQDLNFMKPDILKKINRMEDMEPIWDIRWLQQPTGERVKPHRFRPVPDRKLDPDQVRSFADMTGIIGDEQCRNSLLELWKTFQKKQRRGEG